MSPPPARAATDGRVRLVLAVLGLVVYLPGLTWGLPHATGPQRAHGWDVDGISGLSVLAEFHNLLTAPRPDWYVAYPLFHYVVLGVLYAPYLGFQLLVGGLSRPSGTYPYGLADPVTTLAHLALLGRLVTTAMAVGVVLAAYETGKTVWDKATGLVAAAGILLATPMVYYARTANLDVPVLFWMSLSLLLMARGLASGLAVRRGVWLGIVAALAVATKDQAYAPLVLGLAFVALSSGRLRREDSPAEGPSRPIAAMIVAGAVAYALASGLLLFPRRFLLHLDYVVHFKEMAYRVVRPDGEVLYGFGGNALRPSTMIGNLALIGDALDAMTEAMGPVGIALAALGVILTLRSSAVARCLLLMFAGHVLMVVLPVHHMQYRYALFPAFVASLFAARAAVLGWRRPGVARALALGGTALWLGWLAAKGADLTYQMLFDARKAAGKCLEALLQPGDEVGFFGGIDQLPALPSGVAIRRLPPDASVLQALAEAPPRLVIVSPDAWSAPGQEHSGLLSKVVYDGLTDGSAGYRRLASFETPSLIGRPVRFLPIVNPAVQIFGAPGAGIAGLHGGCGSVARAP